jgi:hypothetical protein
LTAVKERRIAPRHLRDGGDMTKQQETEEVYR